MYQVFSYCCVAVMMILCILAVIKPLGQKEAWAVTKKITTFADKYYVVLLGLTFLAFLATRLFRLGIVPAGIHIDELGAAFDAQCVANYGVDRYLEWFPVYFKNFGGGQNALYTYLAAFMVKAAGFSLVKFRLVAVFCGILCFFASVDLTTRMFQKWAGLLAGILVTILPVYMMSQRWGLESYLLLSFLTISVDFYVRAITTQKTGYYILSGILFGITLYTYAISYIIIPLFMIFITLYMMWTGRFDFKKTFLMAVPMVILALPLVLLQFVNMGLIPEIRTPFFSIYKMAFYRGGEISLLNIKDNLDALWNVLHYDPKLIYNGTPEYGTVYEMTLPLALAGLCSCIYKTIKTIRKKEFSFETLILILFLCAWFAMLIITEPNVNKANGVFLTILLLTIVAFHMIASWKQEMLLIPLILYFVTFLSFSNFYFRQYNTAYESYEWFETCDFGTSVEYVRDNFDITNRNVYVFSKEVNTAELQLVTFGGVSPYDYKEGSVRQGSYVQELPEELDLNEDCIYVIHEYLHHVSDYLAQNGYERLQLPTGYSILYHSSQLKQK